MGASTLGLRAPAQAGASLGRWALSGRAGGACLGGLLLLAFALRLWGLSWQLPHLLYYDELKYARPALAETLGIDGQQPDYRNPSLFRHLLELEYRGLRSLGLIRPADPDEVDPGLLASTLLLARLTVALLGSASVVLLYLAGRAMLGQTAGLVAATLLAVNFLHVHSSHFGLNDVPASFFLVAALVPTASFLDRPNGRALLLAGLLSGLAAAAKYNFAIVVAAPAAAWLLHLGRRSLPRPLLLLGPPLLLLGLLGGLLIGMPEALWSSQEVLQGVLRQAALGSRPWDGQAPDPIALLYARTLAHSFGLPGLLLAVAGLVLLLWRRRPVGLVLAAVPLLYLVVMLRQQLFFARFALPLVPFLCLFAAYGLYALWSSVHASRPGSALLVAATVAAIGWPLLHSGRLNLLAGETDTRVEAWRWSALNLPTGARVAAQIYSLPIASDGNELPRTRQVKSFGGLTESDSFRELACDGYQYVLTASFQHDRQRTRGQRGVPTGYEQLWEQAEVVSAFWPGVGGSSVPFHVDDTGLPFWELARYARPGPTVQVYRLPPGACQPRR